MTEKRLAVSLGAGATPVGELVFESSRPNGSQFVYDDAWLLNGNSTVSPDLLPVSGWQALRRRGRRSPFPMAFADTEPDSWGRRVIDRAYRKSGLKQGRLDDSDYLLAVDDFSRVGALRFSRPGECPEVPDVGRRRTPTLIDLSRIYSAGQRLETDRETLEDLRYLEGKGTSLGGARPKCTVIDEAGNLCLAKFPSAVDSRDIEKGEVLALTLAAKAGIKAATGVVKTIDGVSVGLIRRFDRVTGTDRRIPYWSMATFLRQTDEAEPVAYSDLFEALLSVTTDDWQTVGAEIFRRVLFSCLVSNFDDHSHNTGILMKADGSWTLSPAFDINPMPLKRPDAPYESKLYLTPETGPVESVAQVMEAADDFGLTKTMAATVLKEVYAAVADWKTVARSPAVGMTAKDIKDYVPAFEHVRADEAMQLLSSF